MMCWVKGNDEGGGDPPKANIAHIIWDQTKVVFKKFYLLFQSINCILP